MQLISQFFSGWKYCKEQTYGDLFACINWSADGPSVKQLKSAILSFLIISITVGVRSVCHSQNLIKLLLLLPPRPLLRQQSLPSPPPLPLVLVLAVDQPPDLGLQRLVLRHRLHDVFQGRGPGRDGRRVDCAAAAGRCRFYGGRSGFC